MSFCHSLAPLVLPAARRFQRPLRCRPRSSVRRILLFILRAAFPPRSPARLHRPLCPAPSTCRSLLSIAPKSRPERRQQGSLCKRSASLATSTFHSLIQASALSACTDLTPCGRRSTSKPLRSAKLDWLKNHDCNTSRL